MLLDDEQSAPPIDYRVVTLRDRAQGTPPLEVLFNGQPFKWSPERQEMTLPYVVARHLLTKGHAHAHTNEGFVCRLAAINPPPELVIECGGEFILDASPVQVETGRIEGWDVDSADPMRSQAQVIPVGAVRADFFNQGMPSRTLIRDH
jgi:hypothetical protein